MTRQDLVDLTEDPDLLFADGFDDALLGVAARCGQPTLVVYDRAKCIEILVKKMRRPDGQDSDYSGDAEEYFAFNVEGAWVGLRTPVFLVKPEGLDDSKESA